MRDKLKLLWEAASLKLAKLWDKLKVAAAFVGGFILAARLASNARSTPDVRGREDDWEYERDYLKAERKRAERPRRGGF